MEIVEVLGYDPNTKDISLNTLYEFRESKESTKTKVSGQLVRTSNPMGNTQKLQVAGIDREI